MQQRGLKLISQREAGLANLVEWFQAGLAIKPDQPELDSFEHRFPSGAHGQLAIECLTCEVAVWIDIPNMSAISVNENPFVTSCSTSVSRGVTDPDMVG